MFFVRSYTYWKQDVSGEIYQKISQIGSWYTIISQFGKNRKKTERVFNKFCNYSQSVKNTDTAKEKGYDAGKKISGIKRHIAVDSQGLPHAINVTTADVTDRNGAIGLLKINKNNLTDVKNVMADFGYSGENFARAVHKIIGSKVEIIKRNDAHKFSVIPRRWVVERTFAWFEKFRRLWKNCERLLLSSLSFLLLSLISILIKRF